MVKPLDPIEAPQRQKSPSQALVTDHEKRIEAELAQLLIDIRRIGPTYPDGEPHVLFGELFDDDEVQQYYEALVGTLKSAKKRGVITFKGQMLLKGMHDNVKISILEVGGDSNSEKKKVVTQQSSPATQQQQDTPATKAPAGKATKESPARSKPQPQPLTKQESPGQKAHQASPARPVERKPATKAPAGKATQESPARSTPQPQSLTTQESPGQKAHQSSPARPPAERKPLRSFSFSPRVSPAGSPVVTRRKPSVEPSSSSPYLPSLRNSSPAKWKTPVGKSRPLLPRQPSDSSIEAPCTSPIVERPKTEIAGTASDGEAEVVIRRQSFSPVQKTPYTCSDSEAEEPRRRGRIALPPAFLHNSKPTLSIDAAGRPPAPWRMRKTKSTMSVVRNVDVANDDKARRASSSPVQSARKKQTDVDEMAKDKNVVETNKSVKLETPSPMVKSRPRSNSGKAKVIDETAKDKNVVTTEKSVKLETPSPVVKPRPRSTSGKARVMIRRELASVTPENTKENDSTFSGNIASEPRRLSKSSLLSSEASFRVDHEVHELVKDICRVGSNPGEGSVTFGELFDDEKVQQTYEALVGTLRSAKRQGFITFKGQMLFKGMHDDVTIYVVEEKQPGT